jgi:hypothetical protein
MATVELGPLKEDEARIKNIWMSIDAGQRVLMTPTTKLVGLPPRVFHVGDALEGHAVGQVVESRNPGLPVGTIVVTNRGWREYFTISGKPDGFALRVLESPADPLQSLLHIMSVFGASAFFHVVDGAKPKAGETVWISTAAGTTGSIACQIAKILNCKVIGTAGTDEKVAWLTNELKLDAAFNYRRPDFREAIRSACPDGLDIFIDYAGGTQFEVAIDLMKPHGRIIKVGDTSSYDGGPPTSPKNLFQVVLKRLDILGRSVFDYLQPPSLMANAYAQLGAWVAEGKIKIRETVYQGIENAPQAQIDLFRGKNIGKMLVKLGEREAA